jgi:CDP-diacylglycerol--inositol 3-phosphatidyltransferase
MSVTPTQILLYVPNLIGYSRIILLVLSLTTMLIDPYTTAALYMLSAFLDAFDGHAARMLNQCTKFGAMLDQLTDRVATSMLLMALCVKYPQYIIWFQLSMGLDIVAHWLHCHVTLEMGKGSHKAFGPESNPILRIYYTNRKVLFAMCAGNEIFYSSLYFLAFIPNSVLLRGLTLISFPVAVVKSLIALVQLCYAARNLAEIDAKDASKKTITTVITK